MPPYRQMTEEEIDQVAEMLSTGVTVEVDHGLVTMLGLMSPDLTTRVGKLRGQTEEEARAWADAYLRERGHPSTWGIRLSDEEYPPGDQGACARCRYSQIGPCPVSTMSTPLARLPERQPLVPARCSCRDVAPRRGAAPPREAPPGAPQVLDQPSAAP